MEQKEEGLELLQKQTEQLDYIIRLLEQQTNMQTGVKSGKQPEVEAQSDVILQIQQTSEQLRQEKLRAIERRVEERNAQEGMQPVQGTTEPRPEVQPQPAGQVVEPVPEVQPVREVLEHGQVAQWNQVEEQRRRMEEQRRRDGLVRNRQREVNKSDNNVETKFGTIVIGTIGVVLILAALTILAVNYMTQELQGILLFLGAVLVILVGEIPVRKRLPKFSIAITSLGVALFYLAILLNYFSLLYLPELVVILLAISATAVSVWLSYRNNSAIIRCIALVGGYLCMYPMEEKMDIIQMISVILVVSMIGLGHLFISLPKNTFLADLITNGLNLIIFFRLADCMNLFQKTNRLGVILLAVYGGIIVLTACLFCKRQQGLDQRFGSRAASVIIATVTTLAVIIGLSLSGTVFGYLIPLLAVFAVLFSEKKKGFWTSYIPGIWLTLFFFFGELLDRLEDVITIPSELELMPIMLVLMVLFTWLIAQKIRGHLIFAWKGFVTAISVFYFLFFTELLTGAVFVLVYLIIFFLIRERKDAPFERDFMIFGRFLCLLYLLIFGYRWLDWIDNRTGEQLFGEYGFVGSYVLLVNLFVILFIIITTIVERYRFRNDEQPRTIILIMVILLHLLSPLFSMVEFSFVFIAGSAMILFLWKPPYTLQFRGKPLIYFLYCSYMYVCAQNVYDIQLSVVSTIGLMVIAFLAIIYGSRKNHRAVRIYGLILSLIVCFKLIFWDLGDISLLVKIILFLSVGILALAISYVYNRMEARIRQESKDNNSKIGLSGEDEGEKQEVMEPQEKSGEE